MWQRFVGELAEDSTSKSHRPHVGGGESVAEICWGTSRGLHVEKLPVLFIPDAGYHTTYGASHSTLDSLFGLLLLEQSLKLVNGIYERQSRRGKREYLGQHDLPDMAGEFTRPHQVVARLRISRAK